jgi:hypothetical protein
MKGIRAERYKKILLIKKDSPTSLVDLSKINNARAAIGWIGTG